jgi:hypothetical protein
VRVKALHLALTGNDAAADGLLRNPAPWELPGSGREGWTEAGAQSLAPFLQAFEEAMRKVDARWPKTPPVLEFLGLSRPELGQQAVQTHHADYLALPRFNELRRAAKLVEGSDATPGGPDRFLPAPPIDADALQRPYAD